MYKCSWSCILINKIIAITHRGISVSITQLHAIIRFLTVSAFGTSTTCQIWQDILPWTDVYIVLNTSLNFHIWRRSIIENRQSELWELSFIEASNLPVYRRSQKFNSLFISVLSFWIMLPFKRFLHVLTLTMINLHFRILESRNYFDKYLTRSALCC